MIGANYDANLMFVPEETDGSVLQDFSIAGQLNLANMHKDLILEQPADKENSPGSSGQIMLQN